MKLIRNIVILLLPITLFFQGCDTSARERVSTEDISIVEQTRNKLLERIIAQTPQEELNQISNQEILRMLSKEEKDIFGHEHWRFTVDKPALVSVMRHTKQEIVPFWLEESGFQKTDKSVSNANYSYEVWQKEFPAGEIKLGINGFDLHRVVYFVTIGPITGGEMPKIIRHTPDKWKVIRMEKGAYMYNDWDELLVNELPDELVGHMLFTTIRGRAREAAIQGSFRETPVPSSSCPDQVMLTWCANPSTTQAIQWRTDTTVKRTLVRYWKDNEAKEAYKEAEATGEILSDRYIYNDPEVKHWEVNLSQLEPDTKYSYMIYDPEAKQENTVFRFHTAPSEKRPFRFLYLGDTHNDDIVKPVLEKAITDAPDAAFLIHSGDHVNTGLFRDLWDKYFDLGKEIFPNLTFVPTLGNHDSQDGLPPTLYTRLFMLPQNDSCGLAPERNYAFSYGDARFYMIDATGDLDKIACWLEQELKQTNETWKIAVTHFPPYATDDSYPDIRKTWCSLFDKYHVDLVLSGHIHQYFRSYPIYNEKVVSDTKDGTVYISSVTVEPREPEPASEKYNGVYANKGGLYQVVSIDSHTLEFTSRRIDGTVIDHFQLKK